jgi:hypothetical protein
LATDFPVDAVTHGFDNNAEALTISAVLLDRYLASAEMIAQRAILTKMPERKVLSATQRSLQPNQKGFREGFRLLDSGSHERHALGPLRSPAPNGAGSRDSLLQFAATNDFIFRAIVYAKTSSKSPVHAALFIAGPGLMEYTTDDEIGKLMGDVHHRDLQPMKILKTFEVTGRSEDKPQRVELQVNRRGRTGPIANIGIALVKPAEDEPPVKLYVKLEAEGPLPLRSHVLLVNATADKPQAEQTREIIGRLLPRAFRRPVTNDEIEAVAKFADQAVADGLQWEDGIRRALMAILCSPKFLFRVELDDRPDSTGPHPISEFQLASRLSYFLWSSMPDDELFELAAKGRLSANLDVQVRRMLADPKAIALVDNFAMQWLKLNSLQTHAPDPEVFPKFDDALRASMLTETRLFLHSIIREDRSLLDLLQTDYTFLNRRLGEHYGIVDTIGNRRWRKEIELRGRPLPSNHFVRVALKDAQRGGLLTQASILTLTSSPARTSPVKRGTWVLENILGTPPPPPPPNVPELDAKKEAEPVTLRQRLEQHRENKACAACHAKIDPLGFAFEHYDAVGAFREKDGETVIDASGTLPDGSTIDGVVELREKLLEDKDAFTRFLAEKMLTYALGRGVEYYDRRAIDQIVSDVANDDYKLSRLVTAIANSDPFRLRRGKDEAQ